MSPNPFVKRILCMLKIRKSDFFEYVCSIMINKVCEPCLVDWWLYCLVHLTSKDKFLNEKKKKFLKEPHIVHEYDNNGIYMIIISSGRKLALSGTI